MIELHLSLSRSFPNNPNNMEMKISITTIAVTTHKTLGQTPRQLIITTPIQVYMIGFWMSRSKVCWISNTLGKIIRILMLHLRACMVVECHRQHLNQEKEYCSNSLDHRLNTNQVDCIVVKIRGELSWTLQDQQWQMLLQYCLIEDSVRRMWLIDLKIIWQMLDLLWMSRNLTVKKWWTDLITDIINKLQMQEIMVSRTL